MDDTEFNQMMKNLEGIEMPKSVDELSSLKDDMFILWCENNIRYLEGLKEKMWCLEGLNEILISIEKLKELQNGGLNFLKDRKDEKISNLKMSWCQLCERFTVL